METFAWVFSAVGWFLAVIFSVNRAIKAVFPANHAIDLVSAEKKPLYGKKVNIFCEDVKRNLCGLNLLAKKLEKDGAEVSMSSDPQDNPEDQKSFSADIAIIITDKEAWVKKDKSAIWFKTARFSHYVDSPMALQQCDVLDLVIDKVREVIL